MAEGQRPDRSGNNRPSPPQARAAAIAAFFGGVWRLVVPSVTRGTRNAKRAIQVVTRPSATWRLFEWPRGAVTWVFCVEPLIAGWIVVEVVQARYQTWDLIRFTIIATCALLYVIATRVGEERRRGAHGNATHVDHTSIWFFSSALVLPVPLTLLLVVIVRTHRWFIARKPFYKWLHTTFAIALSVLAVHAVTAGTPLREWLTGQRGLPSEPVTMLVAAGALLAAMAAYFVAQAVLVGAARGLAAQRWDLVEMLGTRRDNAEIMFALLLAVCAALVQALSAPLLLLVVPLALYATALEQRLAQAEVEAGYDKLTGLPNRRSFDDAAASALANARRSRRPVSLLILDLDHFKRFNDTLGHLGGDQVLVAFAGALRASTRQGDLLCRWGGEECAVILPDTGPDDAATLAERIRAQVASTRIPVTKAAGGDTVMLGERDHAGKVITPGCTVSIGVAAFPDHGTTLHELSEHADQALYQAKNDGRNTVRMSPGLTYTCCLPVDQV